MKNSEIKVGDKLVFVRPTSGEVIDSSQIDNKNLVEVRALHFNKKLKQETATIMDSKNQYIEVPTQNLSRPLAAGK